MNREVLYRGFSTESKCWIYGNYEEVDFEGSIFCYIFWQGNSINVVAESVGEYTGIKIEDKRVFEGDILKYNSNDLTYEVGFNSAFGCFEMRNSEYFKMYGANKYFNEYKILDALKIVGNIYENPELLTDNA